MAFEVIHSETVYQGRAFNVRREEVRLPDGNSTRLDIVEHVGAVTLVPVDEQNRIWFVRQYRHAAGEVLLELPAGTIEAGEAPLECARREIREEIGMAAGKLELLGEYFMAPGYSSEFMHVYLATGLTPDPLEGDADEFLSVEAIPIAEVLHMVEARKVRDAKTLACLMMMRGKLPLDKTNMIS